MFPDDAPHLLFTTLLGFTWPHLTRHMKDTAILIGTMPI